VNFDPPRICLHDGGFIWSPGYVPPVVSVRGIDLLVPRIALGGSNPTWHRHLLFTENTADGHNQNKAKEQDRTHYKRWLFSERDNGGKYGGEEEGLDKSSWTGWWWTDTGNSRKKHTIEKNGVVGHLDQPGGRWPEEEDPIIEFGIFFDTGCLRTRLLGGRPKKRQIQTKSMFRLKANNSRL